MGIFEDTAEDKDKDINEEDNTTKELNTYLKTIQDSTNTAIKQMKLEQNRDMWEKLIVAMEDNIEIVSLRSIAVLAEKMKKSDVFYSSSLIPFGKNSEISPPFRYMSRTIDEFIAENSGTFTKNTVSIELFNFLFIWAMGCSKSKSLEFLKPLKINLALRALQ